jgi:hypothetical protein
LGKSDDAEQLYRRSIELMGTPDLCVASSRAHEVYE